MARGLDETALRAYFVPAAIRSFAGSLETVRPLEPSKLHLDLAPRLGAALFGEAGEHLMQRAEGLLLRAHALRRRGQPQRCAHPADLDVGETGSLVGGLDHAGFSEAEGAGLPRHGRR